MELYGQKANFYNVIGVTRDSSSADIKRAFRQRSVELHPDENKSPTATEESNRLRLAFDIIGDVNKRPLYDLFGENAMNKDLWSMQIEALVGSLTFYAIWTVLTFVLTLSEKAQEARAWSLASGVLCFILELNFIYVMHSVFPPFLNGCRAIGGYFHDDLARENFALSIELLKSNQDILLSIRQLQGEVASSSRRWTEVTKGDGVPIAVKKRLKMEKHSAASQGAAGLIRDENLEELRKMATPEPEVQKIENGSGIARWLWAIGIYFAIIYFFSN
ncbi:hypothetical protein PsorP6_006520 [Peronosclerospora sorghi]|uniref:Uncharacterized protein n=1 Tax=Peronosclerospora sorghi TaxID=230839 RepID=A0ACC0W7S7_9STRA|nr:hypothetical protein PsorP6_006520 [Peronosclerospora sorghi]